MQLREWQDLNMTGKRFIIISLVSMTLLAAGFAYLLAYLLSLIRSAWA